MNPSLTWRFIRRIERDFDTHTRQWPRFSMNRGH
jgi:hypothetical protein